MFIVVGNFHAITDKRKPAHGGLDGVFSYLAETLVEKDCYI